MLAKDRWPTRGSLDSEGLQYLSAKPFVLDRHREIDVRAFLLVASEAKAPNMFVTDGQSIRGKVPIDGSTGYFMVRRTLKAAGSFSRKASANYVCLVEVFAPR